MPVIALSANALAAERAHCFEAGMDDHLAKPIVMGDLRKALGRWLAAEHHDATRVATGTLVEHGTPMAVAEAIAGAGAGDGGPVPELVPDFDPAQLEDALGDDPEIISDALAILRREGRAALGRIGAAQAQGDAEAVAAAAHVLAGSTSTLGFMACAAAARRVEASARAGRIPAAELAALREAWTRAERIEPLEV